MDTPPENTAPGGADDGAGARRRRLSVPSLGTQVLAALILGAVLGFAAPSLSEHLKIVGDGFIRLITMSIVPLVFPLVVVTIARLESAKSVGRLAGKALLYFEVVTTAILILTLGLAVITGLGKGTNLTVLVPADTHTIQNSIDIQSLLLNIIPENVVSALGKGDLIAVLFFAVFLGLALTRIGGKATPVIAVLDGLASAMFQLISWIVKLTPLAVVSFVAYNTAHYGWGLVGKLAVFVAVFYAAAIVVIAVVFPLIGVIFRVPYVPMMRAIGDLLLLSFVTRSAEVVMAPLITRLDAFGVDPTVPSFVLPLGYSFNSDGATMYEGLAVVFLAHAYGVELTIPKLIAALLVLMLLTKGIAGVPSAAIVVLFSASATIGLPAEGVAILLVVDFVVDMARTALNVSGNALATVVIAKSEGLYPAAAWRVPDGDAKEVTGRA